jgi:hypothetical protein
MSRLSAVLVTQQRSLDAWPVKQDTPPARPHTGDFAGRAPVEQRAAADWQPRQQLLLVNEASFAYQSLALFAIHSRTDFIRTGTGDSAIIAQNDAPDLMANWRRIITIEHEKLNPFAMRRILCPPILRRISGGNDAALPATIRRVVRRTAGGIAGVCPAVYPLKCPGSIRATAGKFPGSVPSNARKKRDASALKPCA